MTAQRACHPPCSQRTRTRMGHPVPSGAESPGLGLSKAARLKAVPSPKRFMRMDSIQFSKTDVAL